MSGCLGMPWLGVAALLVLTYFEHRSNARTDSSTAGLVFVGSWLIGIPIAVVSVAIDASLRERVVRRKAA